MQNCHLGNVPLALECYPKPLAGFEAVWLSKKNSGRQGVLHASLFIFLWNWIISWELYLKVFWGFFLIFYCAGTPRGIIFIDPIVFQVSTNMIRKYSGPIDIWLSIICSIHYASENMHCLVNEHPRRSFQAMAQHQSQWVWYVCFLIYHMLTFIELHLCTIPYPSLLLTLCNKMRSKHKWWFKYFASFPLGTNMEF